MITRDEYVVGLAENILKTAAEEIEDSPFAKFASEAQAEEVLVEKVAGVYDEAAAIYKCAEETAIAADNQEADARAALEAHGIDPDVVIAAAEEAAAAEIENQSGTEAADE